MVAYHVTNFGRDWHEEDECPGRSCAYLVQRIGSAKRSLPIDYLDQPANLPDDWGYASASLGMGAHRSDNPQENP